MLLNNKEQGFLQGVLSALMNKSKTWGVIGGQDIPPIKNMTIGFAAGSKYINPDIKVLDAFTGDFDDASKVKEQALSMIGQGADIVCVSVNNAGRDAFDAAKEKGLYAIASIYVDFNEYKDFVLALG